MTESLSRQIFWLVVAAAKWLAIAFSEHVLNYFIFFFSIFELWILMFGFLLTLALNLINSWWVFRTFHYTFLNHGVEKPACLAANSSYTHSCQVGLKPEHNVLMFRILMQQLIYCGTFCPQWTWAALTTCLDYVNWTWRTCLQFSFTAWRKYCCKFV